MRVPATAAVRLLAGDKEPVRLASTANLALSGLLTVDGVVSVSGDRILAKNQTDATENGIYIASEGLWRRSPDDNSTRLMRQGMKVHVQEGTDHGGNVFMLNTNAPDIGTDDIEWEFYFDSAMMDYLIDLIAEITGQISSAGIADYPTRAVVTVSTVSVSATYLRTNGYTNAGDGGGGLYKKVGSEPSHGGKVQTGNGLWFELVEPIVRPEMFGAVGDGVTNDTAALNLADAFSKPVRLTEGKTYLATGQLSLCQVDGARWFVDGGRGSATIKSSYNGGACILLGPAATLVNDVAFENIKFYQNDASTQTMFEVRGIRGMHFLNCYLDNIYFGYKLGTATRSTYIFNLYQCEVHMRLATHSHFIDVVNSAGQIDLQDTFVEGNFISGSVGMRIASNVQARVDHLIMMGGYFSRFEKNFYLNHRATSIQMGDGLHMEGQTAYGIEVDSNGSWENWTITGCTFGTTSVSVFNGIYIHYTQTTENCSGLVISGNVFQLVKGSSAIEIAGPSGNRPNGVIISGNAFPACIDSSDNNHAVIELNQINSGSIAGNAAVNSNGSLRFAYIVRSQNSQAGLVVDANSHGIAGAGTGVTLRS